jgi:hypothetical protein
MFRDWAWQINEKKTGPDHHFYAHFEAPDTEVLPALVKAASLPGFVLQEARNEFYSQNLHDIRASGQRRNVWVYSVIRFSSNSIEFERGYGGGGGSGETALIVALASSPDLILKSWKVTSSYEGFEWNTIADGTSAEELLAYLRAKPLPQSKPDFGHVEKTLREALALPDIAALFKLADLTVGEWMCQAVVHYVHDTSQIVKEQDPLNRFAGSEPYTEQICRVVITVAEACDIPARLAQSLFDRNCIIGPHPTEPKYNLYKPLGFVLQFGYCMAMGYYDHPCEFERL